jgi:arylsulfatase A-like enzyme
VLLLFCCGEAPGQLNVLIIAVDTLCADHLGCYGYDRDTSPNTDRLASGGVLCENCLSQAPWTLPSFATLFTSLFPTQHGATAVQSRVRDSFPTLAGILKEHGYATGAVVNAPALKPANGVARGFDFYNMTPLDGRNAAGTTRDVLAWIDKAGDQPFLMFAHYFDPHLSYSPPPPYDKLFDPHYEGRIGDSFNLEGFSLVRDSMFVQMKELSDADWNHIVSLYDGEIAFTDSAIGELLGGLEERGLTDRTLIVYMSDHGEEFYEHGGFEHGHTLYNELIHVPLIFSLPGSLPANARVARQVRLLDVAPTVLDILNLPPQPHFEGVSLAPVLRGEGPAVASETSLLPQHVSYAEALMHGREKKCVSEYPWKLVYEMRTERKVLFDLDSDPDERQDLLEREPDEAGRLEERLVEALFGVSGTWYIEVGAGRNLHSFDVSVAAGRGLMPGTFNVHRLLDSGGGLVEAGALKLARNGSLLRLEDFGMKGSATVAFKVEPSKIPLEFDLRIDGQPATGQTYLGRSMVQPGDMPFTQKGRRAKTTSEGRPAGELDPPYILVWFEESSYKGDTAIQLDEETKKELRSLGYIQ